MAGLLPNGKIRPVFGFRAAAFAATTVLWPLRRWRRDKESRDGIGDGGRRRDEADGEQRIEEGASIEIDRPSSDRNVSEGVRERC